MRKTINVLLVVAVVFWVVVLAGYIAYYVPALQALNGYYGNLIWIEGAGTHLGYIWLNFAKISTFAFGTIATLVFLAQREKPPV